MDFHRIQPPLSRPQIECFDCPEFSSFRFLKKKFALSSRPIHRAFSLARTLGCHVLVVEQIDAAGLLELDTIEVRDLGGWSKAEVYRISFWKTKFDSRMVADDLATDDLLGYIIIKFDGGVFIRGGRRFVNQFWYVFEGVFKARTDGTTYLPRQTLYRVRVGKNIHFIPGVLYCQQNGINKCCAHVALRSILSRIVMGNDVSYMVMNDIIEPWPKGTLYYPGDGLFVPQMQSVLNAFGVPFFDRDYHSLRVAPSENKDKFTFPYQSYLYSGVETGCGAIMNFRVGKDASTSRDAHALPIFGHTFNKDTWVADAESVYFRLTDDAGFMRSDVWTGDFLMHDDNHGCNFTLPRSQLSAERVDYVCAIHEPGTLLNPMLAESATLHFLHNFDRFLDKSNIWNVELSNLLRILQRRDHLQSLVLRTVTATKDTYLANLAKGDAQGNSEISAVMSFLKNAKFFKKLIVVEISFPQLFPANQHRIGEFIFDAGIDVGDRMSVVYKDAFLFARLPGRFFFSDKLGSGSRGGIFVHPSSLVDHISVLSA